MTSTDVMIKSAQPLHCLYHPGNVIHNFCSNPECLLPMCPTCVGIHTIEHQENATFPRFVNLQDLLESVRRDLDASCGKLQQFSQTYTNDYWNKQKMAEECKRRLKELKTKLAREMQLSFSNLQLRILKRIEQFDEKVHEKYRHLEEEIQYLYESIKLQLAGLEQSEKLLKNLILFKVENQTDKISQWMSKFQADIQQLRKESIKIQIETGVNEQIDKVMQCAQLVEFEDSQNEYLQASPRQILNSDRSFAQTPDDRRH